MKILNETQKTLTEHQQGVFDSIIEMVESKVSSILKTTNIEDYILSLTGAAGTGKTYLTTQIAKYFIAKQKSLEHTFNSDYSFVITAPTHKAVGVLSEHLQQHKINASCKTIHSFLGIKPFIDYATGEEKFKVDKTKKLKDTTSILMVDESSMVGTELYEYILEAIEEGRVGLVLFIGDSYQLLPVNDNENRIYHLPNQYNLEEIVRQAQDSTIIRIATKLRDRIKENNYIHLIDFFKGFSSDLSDVKFIHNKNDFLEDFYKNKEWHKEDKILATHQNKNVDAFNKAIRTKYWEERGVLNPKALLVGDTVRFNDAYSMGDVTLYHNGQSVALEEAVWHYHPDLEIEFWECKAVDSAKQQIFRVVDPDSLSTFNDKLTAIAKKARASRFPENKKLWVTFYAVRNMYANVQYTYASTIHKLQGSTYKTAYIDLFSLINNYNMSNSEKYRLVYVALTRASKDVKIFMPALKGTHTAMDAIETMDMVENFKTIDKMLNGIDLP